MATTRDGTLTNIQTTELLNKLRNADMDYRYMALNDLLTELQKSDVAYDDSVASRLTEAVLKTLEDKHGEVQNLAIKCLGPLVKRCRGTQIQMVVDRLCKTKTNDELRDISSTALRTVIMSIPSTSLAATSVTKKLVPRLLLQLRDFADTSEPLLDAIDVLIELVSKFESALPSLPDEDEEGLVKALMTLLDSTRPAVRKRAVIALGNLILCLPEDRFASFMSEIIQTLSVTKLNEKLQTLISLLGQVCRSEQLRASNIFAGYLQTLTPAVVDSLAILDDELREISLLTLESFVLLRSSQLKRYENKIADQALECLKYDPNYNDEDDDDNEDMVDVEEGSDLGSDFEEEAEYDDDDDVSWKIRRAAAKLASALIQTDTNGESGTIPRLTKALVARFDEREENVRLEILQTFALLLEKSDSRTRTRPPNSRKRSRDEDEMDIERENVPHTTVMSLSSKILKNITKQLSGRNLQMRQVCFAILASLGRLDSPAVVHDLAQILPLANQALLQSSTNSTASTVSGVKISVLDFLSCLVANGELSQLDKCAEDIVQILTGSLSTERIDRVTLRILLTMRDMLQAFVTWNQPSHFSSIANALFRKISADDLEQDVRDELIAIVGECIWIGSQSSTNEACKVLSDRVQQESTRLIAITTIGKAVRKPADLPQHWLVAMTEEILKYVSSVNRSLRFAAIVTSTALVARSGPYLSDRVVKQICQIITSSLEAEDGQISLSIITWLSALAQTVKQKDLIKTMTMPAVHRTINNSSTQAGGLSTPYLLTFFRGVSDDGGSRDVLDSLYANASSSSNLSLTAKFISAVLVDDSNSSIEECINSVRAPKTSEYRRALDIHVIGEYGKRRAIPTGTSEILLAQFNSPSDQVKGAASTALGGIASYDPTNFVPRLLKELQKDKEHQYLLAGSFKELIIQTSSEPQSQILADQAEDLCAVFLNIAVDERANGMLAESIGRLTQLRPSQLLPRLRSEVNSKSSETRGLVIRAIRFTFTAPSTNFDDQLRPLIVDFLSLMEDSDLEIRRLAMSTLYSAAHNKPHLILDHLNALLPKLYQETVIKKDMIHTVTMGPFKHIVDDGLELRKNAFETVYTLLESFHATMDIPAVFQIVLRGCDDVHEIKILCFLMASHLKTVAPVETRQNLDAIAEKLQKHMMMKLKDTAVKQDKEKDAELKRAILRCAISLLPLSNDASPGYQSFMAEMTATRAHEMEELKTQTPLLNATTRMEI